ncbi:peptidoglycan-associated lipoprotein Pal [Massilia sp. IC2-477]|uniref:peptidoglycan-associated lipoprotein Pal n=1 Tax=unclassified Massilia TaxID=2609279 RepID=UPI001D12DFA3|nr:MULTISPECIES: peptidoglycan-associated lipoprotein Pal [unclassified Massilia]MCC2956473.1 peptidoglycan-associated lipoprotein Pal [Massilia sp. IC2-477]MCC2972162.1 peptidoglycan-associated lipoprotein Pal [Massilia sp. IC2-476]
MRNFQKVALIASALVLTACSSSPKLNETPVVEKTPTPPAAQPDARDIRPVETGSVDPLNDPKGPLANRSVYFDYDSFVVREDGKPVVANHSGFLTKNAGRKVLIQGNTDERGGTEYNLALGQKRAEAVRRAMGALGVSDNQMEAVSLGEEKPKATGSDEAAWAENRRADIVYQ